MKISTTILLRIAMLSGTLSSVVAPSPSHHGDPEVFSSSETVVLAQGQVFKSWQGGPRRYHQNRCQIKLQRDGNFIVERLVAPNPWYQTYHVSWSTGVGGGPRPHDGSSTYYYKASLDGHDGSLLVTRQNDKSTTHGDETVVYTSNVGDPQALEDYITPLQRKHKLVITEECVLKTYRDSKVVVWTNNRFGGLGGEAGISDYLQRGEMFTVKQCYGMDSKNEEDCMFWYPHTLLLQHDCNLVQFVGQDLADLKENPTILWSSNTRRPGLHDCYLYSDEDKVRLYEGKLDKSLPQFAPRAEEWYWEADDDFQNPCSGGYEVLLMQEGGLEASC